MAVWAAIAAVAAVGTLILGGIGLWWITKPLSAKANDIQAGLLAIEEARRRDELAPDFELTYEPQHPDPLYPDCGQLVLTYEGSALCERLVIEELRGARWATAVVSIERHSPHTSTGNVTTDIHTHLEPGDVRPFVVRLDPDGRAGEIRLRLTATVNGHEYSPIVRSCRVEPPAKDFAYVVGPQGR